jgi:hypothetical protein
VSQVYSHFVLGWYFIGVGNRKLLFEITWERSVSCGTENGTDSFESLHVSSLTAA